MKLRKQIFPNKFRKYVKMVHLLFNIANTFKKFDLLGGSEILLNFLKSKDELQRRRGAAIIANVSCGILLKIKKR